MVQAEGNRAGAEEAIGGSGRCDCGTPPRGAWKRRRGLGETPQGPPGNAAGTCDLSGRQLPMAGPLITLQGRQSKPRRVAAGIHPAPVMPPGGSFEDSQWQMAVHITTILALNFNPPRQNNLLPSLPDTHLRGHRRRENMADNGGPKLQKKAESLPPSTSAKDTPAKPPRLPRKLHPEVIAAQIKDILSALLVFRFINALCVRTFFQPDEYFQALEPAWSIAFGRESGAWLTWVNKYSLPFFASVRGLLT